MPRGDLVVLLRTGIDHDVADPRQQGVWSGTATPEDVRRKRWFPNGTVGVLLGRTYPKGTGVLTYFFDVLIEGVVYPIDNFYLRWVNDAEDR